MPKVGVTGSLASMLAQYLDDQEKNVFVGIESEKEAELLEFPSEIEKNLKKVS